jgi:hypothetical protein
MQLALIIPLDLGAAGPPSLPTAPVYPTQLPTLPQLPPHPSWFPVPGGGGHPGQALPPQPGHPGNALPPAHGRPGHELPDGPPPTGGGGFVWVWVPGLGFVWAPIGAPPVASGGPAEPPGQSNGGPDHPEHPDHPHGGPPGQQ